MNIVAGGGPWTRFEKASLRKGVALRHGSGG